MSETIQVHTKLAMSWVLEQSMCCAVEGTRGNTRTSRITTHIQPKLPYLSCSRCVSLSREYGIPITQAVPAR
jgi:hypothetical protein